MLSENTVYVIDTNAIVHWHPGRDNKESREFRNIYGNNMPKNSVIPRSVYREVGILEGRGQIERGTQRRLSPYILPLRYRLNAEPSVKGLAKGIAKELSKKERGPYLKDILSDEDAEVIAYTFILKRTMEKKNKKIELISEDKLLKSTSRNLEAKALGAYKNYIDKAFGSETDADIDGALEEYERYINC